MAQLDIFMTLVHWDSSHKTKSLASIIFPLISVSDPAIIMGDSIDPPFLGWIRCSSLSHGINADPKMKDEESRDYTTGKITKSSTSSASRASGFKVADEAKRLGVTEDDYKSHFFKGTASKTGDKTDYKAFQQMMERNTGYVDLADPVHAPFVVSKHFDLATPQLAHAVSTKARFSAACIAIRKRVGPGLMGVKLPFFIISMRKVRILKYDMSISGTGEESIALHYGKIHWLMMDSISITGVPAGVMERGYDLTEGGSATESGGMMESFAALQ